MVRKALVLGALLAGLLGALTAVLPAEAVPAAVGETITLTITDATTGLTDASGPPASQVTMRVRAEGTQTMQGLQFTVIYDPTVLGVLSVSTTTEGVLPQGFLFQVGTTTAGEVSVAIVGEDATAVSGFDVADIAFELVGSLGATSPLTFVEALAGDSSLPSQDIPVVSVQGSVSIVGPPKLSIPNNIPAVFGSTVAVPVSFAANGHDIGAVVFSLDFDQACLTFDPTDDDLDGVPDAISFSVPGSFESSATYDASDTDGEIDVAILDPSSPIAALPDGIFADVIFTAACEPQPAQTIVAAVGFSQDPQATFSDTSGVDIPGTTEGGSVEIFAVPRGDCNGDQFVSAADIIGVVLEIFDGDGNQPVDVPGGSFPGTPVGCDSNADGLISAADIICVVLIIFNGPGACGGASAKAIIAPTHLSSALTGGNLDLAELGRGLTPPRREMV